MENVCLMDLIVVDLITLMMEIMMMLGTLLQETYHFALSVCAKVWKICAVLCTVLWSKAWIIICRFQIKFDLQIVYPYLNYYHIISWISSKVMKWISSNFQTVLLTSQGLLVLLHHLDILSPMKIMLIVHG